ncbi:hypothetical protein LRS13_15295 [Svornostia abyssi]|uniref:Uncharacterized protein n=1 Tax=Svornostia abyssi TaxID=2898438 RepID=A0ABY5PBT8_9ACTN|nr:hypothetical protein LRS13_15295 [Parviterribacteraceae bacterium J379]
MTDRLEAVIEWLGRRSLRAQILGIFLDCIVLDTIEDLTWTPEPGYGLSGPDRETIHRALRDEHDRIWAMTYDEILDEVHPEEQKPIAVPNGLPVVLLVEVFVLEEHATVQMRVVLAGPGRCYLGEGPAFVIGRDGSRDPTDDWEAGWR